MKNICGRIEVNEWPDAIRLAQTLIRWAYRGQANQAWGLSSTLERSAQRAQLQPHQLPNREFWIRTQFQRRAHHYIRDTPPEREILDWLALIQHYGGPTRLIDFTHSFYVAAFFALEFSETDSAVWAVDISQLENRLSKKTGIKMAENETIYELNKHYLTLAQKCLTQEKDQASMVIPVEPDRLHERLSIQQGLFLMPTSVSVDFQTNLAATFDETKSMFEAYDDFPVDQFVKDRLDNSYPILKIVLKRNMLSRALNDLRSMNVSSATLFPGLDGFARSLHGHITSIAHIE